MAGLIVPFGFLAFNQPIFITSENVVSWEIDEPHPIIPPNTRIILDFPNQTAFSFGNLFTRVPVPDGGDIVCQRSGLYNFAVNMTYTIQGVFTDIPPHQLITTLDIIDANTLGAISTHDAYSDVISNNNSVTYSHLIDVNIEVAEGNIAIVSVFALQCANGIISIPYSNPLEGQTIVNSNISITFIRDI